MRLMIASGAVAGLVTAAAMSATLTSAVIHPAPEPLTVAEAAPANPLYDLLHNNPIGPAFVQGMAPGLLDHELCAHDADTPHIVCAIFAPDTPDWYIAEVTKKLNQQAMLNGFEPDTRWGGFGAGSGPVSLTYSFPPDGVSLGGYTAENQNFMFQRWNNAFPGGETQWKGLIRQAFDRWEELTGNTYTEVSDDGASWPFSAGQFNGNPNRGDIRIVSSHYDGAGGVLAFNFYPNTGDMLLDSNDLNGYTSSTNNYRWLRNVVMHENGHGMGLDHSCPVSGKLMGPSLQTSFDGPQLDDWLGMQYLYGDRYEPNNSTAAAAPEADTEFLPDSFKTQTQLSINRLTDVDVYKIESFSPAVLTVTVVPTSGAYNAGPQNPNGTCSAGTAFNPATQGDLQIELLSSGGAVLATVNNTGLGQNESLIQFPLNTPDVYYIRISVVSWSDIQGYNLTYLMDGGQPGGLQGDLNGDGSVDGTDLGQLLLAWGACPAPCPADLNGDGVVDGSDLGILLLNWSPAPLTSPLFTAGATGVASR